MPTTHTPTGESSDKQRKRAEAEAKRCAKRYGGEWKAVWFEPTEHHEGYWEADCVSEKTKYHPVFNIEPPFKEFLARLLLLMATHEMEFPDSFKEPMPQDYTFRYGMLDLLLTICGIPHDRNPSGDMGYRGADDFCRDSYHFQVSELSTIEEARAFMDEIIKDSVYRDSQEDALAKAALNSFGEV